MLTVNWNKMPFLPGVSSSTAVRVLGKLGFIVIRQGKHIILSDGFVRLVVPRNNPINAYTMGGIARQAGVTPNEFKALI